MNNQQIPVEKRLWSRVKKTDTCWIWQGALRGGGYGAIWIGGGKGGHHPAHRVSYELTYGAIPAALQVLHRCDNCACVRPDHLFVGTSLDNMHDKIKKGRARYPGPNHPSYHLAKLTPDLVAQIRKEYKPYIVSLNALARKYHVSKRAIHRIIHQITWPEDRH